MKKLLLLSLFIILCQKNFAQETSPCSSSPGATTATPISSTVCTNGIVTLSPSVVPASTLTGITYQWYYSTSSITGPYTSIAGATTAIYPSPQNTVTTWYQVVILCVNGGVPVTSSPASVYVTTCQTSPCTGPPLATAATPASSTVCINGIVTLSPSVVPASSVTGVSYQWQYSTNSALGPYIPIPTGTTVVFTSPQNPVTTWYQVVMTCTNGGEPTTSAPAIVNVINCNPTSSCVASPGATTATPVSSTVCMNGVVTLSPNVVPSASVTGITYQWQYTTGSALGTYSPITSGTTAIFTSPQNTITTWYQVIMTCTNGGIATISSPAVVNVIVCNQNSPCFNSPGATTATPVSSTVCMNGVVTLSPNVVPASSVTGVTYQWQYSTNSNLGPFTSISGATTAIYVTPQNTTTTWYHVVMLCINAGNIVTSSPATVYVTTCQPTPCSGSPGATTATPVSSTVCMNGVVTLSPNVVPSFTVDGVIYQWYYSTISSLGPYTAISGATTAINATPQNTTTTWYQVVMTCTNGGSPTISSPAMVNVVNCTSSCVATPGASTATPVSSTVCINGVVTLSPNVVPSSSVTGITYQWQYTTGSALGTYSPVTSGTTAIFTSPQNTITTWYQVIMTCTNGGIATISSPAVVNVIVCNQTSPCFNSPGATTATPVSNTVCMNGIVTLSPSVVPASTVTGVTYQWYSSTNSASGPYTSVAGATTAIYTTGQNAVTTWYQVVVLCVNGGMPVTSSPAVVNVSVCNQTSPCFASPGATTATPVSSTVCMNGIVTLSPSVVPASTVTGVTYQWYSSTNSASGPYTSIAGATTAIYPTTQNAVTTWYQVVMTCTNGGQATTSSPAIVTVINCNPPNSCVGSPGATTATPVSSTVCVNGIVTLSPNIVPASTLTGITYQWYSSTSSALGPYVPISGANTAIYTTLQNAVTTWYQVVITCTNGGSATTSSPAIVIVINCIPSNSCVTSPGATTATPVSNTVCINGVVTLSPNVVPASTVTGVTYQWQSSTNSAAGPYLSIAGATTAIYTTPQNPLTTWYQIIITCTNGNIATTSTAAKVFVIKCNYTGIKENNNDPGLRIYPVPADQSITLEMSGEDRPVLMSIFSLDGKEIKKEQRDFKNGKLSIDLGGIETGVYIIEISSQNKQTRKLFFIER